MIPYLELSMTSRGARVVGGINDAPALLSDPKGQGKQGRMPINWWLMPGPNRLTVSVEPLPDAEGPPLLDVSIAFPQDAEPPLCRVGWGLPRGTEFAPFQITLPFHPPKQAKSKVWLESVALPELSDEQRAGARALAMGVHKAFASRDIDAIVKLLDYRLGEMSLAFEIDLDRHRGVVREDMYELVNGNAFALMPAEEDTILVKPCCGGRIFQLAREDGGPLIATLETETSNPTTMQVFGALIDGEWRVVR